LNLGVKAILAAAGFSDRPPRGPAGEGAGGLGSGWGRG